MQERPPQYIQGQEMTPPERARLIKLNEELGEVVEAAGRSIKAIGKALNYGWTPEFEQVQYDNRRDLEKELGDVLCATSLLSMKGNLDWGEIWRRAVNKRARMIEMIPHEHHDDDLIGTCSFDEDPPL